MKHVLEEAGTALTTRDIGVRTYGRSQGPPDYAHFASCTYIWAKTFSCMEYMMGEGFVERSERDGIIYWKRPPYILKITGKFRRISALLRDCHTEEQR